MKYNPDPTDERSVRILIKSLPFDRSEDNKLQAIPIDTANKRNMTESNREWIKLSKLTGNSNEEILFKRSKY